MAFSSLADELNLDSGFPMSPSGPGLSLADEFGDMGGGTLADELVDDLALADYAELEPGPLGLDSRLDSGLDTFTGSDKYGSLGRSPRRPARGGARTPGPSVRVSRRHESESNDQLDLSPLLAAQAAGQRMLSRLQTLDGPSPTHRVPLEERLAGFVSRMGAAERVRDEQTREVAALVRDLEGLQGVVAEEDVAYVDMLMDHESPRARRRPPPLQFESDDESHQRPYQRSPLSPLDHNSSSPHAWNEPLSPLHRRPSSPVSPLHRRPSSPLSPLSPSFPNGTHVHAHSQAQACLASHRSALAAATAELGSATGDAADALNKLAGASTTAIQASAGAGETSRQLRKLRVGVASLRQGIEAEETAQRGIDAWEAALVSGTAPDVRSVLAGLMAGFEERLGEMARAHEGLRMRARA
ncbi:uncharacterized protein CcaverHIS019_0411370 [Cutaneotrichosporon cavernicola]|uniref:Uncharacterized protein n=1 Tax=Cutaneotrichosporon cavernicola TaxID=279322 RepID=A0AA48L5J5_9TREE|nr:uncharacterized protein CcaverHIS019_0411370 [Cutaneotrichosporon cavernicola]BEI92317.1 hypothetical protein CcaverHIS019_0411370 [Cutaneotrichosporon cavernicola]BEJ00087.1 hypothetical protein CcaverHIS631_0411290 [Cutaneotrichosporon cavernicola]BEJ07859.1 hypothetical protein CcaverHIS641_0411280 [Cutaneotrichosporon cavernicola]